jgi:hypothetical protein
MTLLGSGAAFPAVAVPPFSQRLIKLHGELGASLARIHIQAPIKTVKNLK